MEVLCWRKLNILAEACCWLSLLQIAHKPHIWWCGNCSCCLSLVAFTIFYCAWIFILWNKSKCLTWKEDVENCWRYMKRGWGKRNACQQLSKMFCINLHFSTRENLFGSIYSPRSESKQHALYIHTKAAIGILFAGFYTNWPCSHRAPFKRNWRPRP